jgi:hypothetical protein
VSAAEEMQFLVHWMFNPRVGKSANAMIATKAETILKGSILELFEESWP